MKVFWVFVASLFIAAESDKSTLPAEKWAIGEPEINIRQIPLLIEKSQSDLITIQISASGSEESLAVDKVELDFSDNSAISSVASISAFYTGVAMGPVKRELLATTTDISNLTLLDGETRISSGTNQFVFSFAAKPDADLLGKIVVKSVKITFSDGSTKTVTPSAESSVIRFGKVLRAAGQDGSDTYRIPGLAATNAGTLIAVYDIRYNNSKDLQEDIDIGMSRSTDGGQTWEPMKVIMDMGEWGGKPEGENGVGDPSVLVDKTTGTIWVAALWLNGAPGQTAWNASRPGLDPTVTGQFLVTKSEDDGLTWSDEINLTAQLKNRLWRLLLQGPGNGISLSDGTIVFPAQFRDADGLPYSTLAWSSDHGNTWHIGTGAKGNTTEAQCVQLSDGSIMLNMRDNRNSSVKDANNGRAVAITRDLGQTWEVHPSSNSALPEPVCMASLIAADLNYDGSVKKILFFSNPNDKYERKHLTIRASTDEGLTWPAKNQIEIFADAGFGYSCLTMVDNNTIGILYEGVKDIYFQKIPVSDLLGNK